MSRKAMARREIIREMATAGKTPMQIAYALELCIRTVTGHLQGFVPERRQSKHKKFAHIRKALTEYAATHTAQECAAEFNVSLAYVYQFKPVKARKGDWTPEYAKAYYAKYRAENRDLIRAKQREHYRRNKQRRAFNGLPKNHTVVL
jgi:hypothetical protein